MQQIFTKAKLNFMESLPEPPGLEGFVRGALAGLGPRVFHRGAPRRRGNARLVHRLCRGEEAEQASGKIRDGRHRGGGGAGRGEQLRRRAAAMVPLLTLGIPSGGSDGGHAGGADDPRPAPGPHALFDQSRVRLGAHRQHVHRERVAGHPEHAAGRHLGSASEGPLQDPDAAHHHDRGDRRSLRRTTTSSTCGSCFSSA